MFVNVRFKLQQLQMLKHGGTFARNLRLGFRAFPELLEDSLVAVSVATC